MARSLKSTALCVTSLATGLIMASSPGLADAPAVPQDVRARARVGGASLAWLGEAGASFRLHRAIASGGPYERVGIWTEPVPPDGRVVLSDGPLEPGRTYYYVVTAFNEDGESAPSAEVAVVPWRYPEFRFWMRVIGAYGIESDAVDRP